MNIAKTIATALANAGLGVLEENIFVGRIQETAMTEKGVWAVAMFGGPPPTTHWKSTPQVQIMAIFASNNDVSMYDLDAKVRRVLTSIPLTDKFVPSVKVSPMQDNDLAEEEARICMWTVATVTINSKEEE